MNPILFDANETTFATNGIGRLTNAISCAVTEERNGIYELDMVYPMKGLNFSAIQTDRIIYAIPADGKAPQPFRVYYISAPLNGEVEISAQHISYQLKWTIVNAFTATSASGALNGFSAHLADTGQSFPFSFTTDVTRAGTFSNSFPQDIRSLLMGQEGSVLDVYGGEYEWHKYQVILHTSRGQDNGVSIKYGKNLTDIQQDANIGETYTGVAAYWKSETDGTTTVVQSNPNVILADTASNFPFHRIKAIDASGDFTPPEGSETGWTPSQSDLTTWANNYIAANDIGVPEVSIDVSFQPLWQTEEYKNIAPLERVNLCDTVTVQFPALGVNAKAKVVRTVYNVLNERYDEIEIGTLKQTLAETIINLSKGGV